MAYTVEPVVAPASAPQQTQQITKEDRVIDPYSSNTRLEKAQAKVAESNGPSVNSVSAAESGQAEESVTLSPQVAALARKEQRFRQQQQTLKQREADLAAREAKLGQLSDLDSKLAAKDYSVIEEKVNYDDYTNYLLNKNANLSPEAQKLNKVETELEAMKKQREEDISRQYDAAKSFRRKAVSELIDTNKEFSKIKKAGEAGKDAVMHHIMETWEKDDIELSPEQAAKEVQEILLAKAKSWNSILEEDPVESNTELKKPLPPLRQGTKTLTNNMTINGEPKKPSRSYSQMSEAERYAEARRRVEEKMKKGN
jgi:hypothetical protein